MVVCVHIFQGNAPLHAHWARTLVSVIGGAGVDIFFVISGFIIYHVVQRSVASMDTVGKWRSVYVFATKRFIRIYPLYWIVFGVACLVMVWAPPAAQPHEPLLKLLTLIDNVPNFRVYVAWTLTFEVYFYAVMALSLLLFAKRAMVGVTIWFAIAVAMLIDRGFLRFHGALLVGAFLWMAAGLVFLMPSVFEQNVANWGRLVATNRSFALHVVGGGIPAAIFIYGLVVLEARQRWIMPPVLQYLGNASYSIYLWHAVVFYAVAEGFIRLGWTGSVSPTALTALMVAIGLGVALVSYHCIETPLLRLLGKRITQPRVYRDSPVMEPSAHQSRPAERPAMSGSPGSGPRD